MALPTYELLRGSAAHSSVSAAAGAPIVQPAPVVQSGPTVQAGPVVQRTAMVGATGQRAGRSVSGLGPGLGLGRPVMGHGFVQRDIDITPPPAAMPVTPEPAAAPPETAPAPEMAATPPQMTAAPPEASAAAPEAGGASAAAPAAQAAAAGQEPEELLKKLYDPLVRRLKAELWLDRERRGALTDRWR